MLFAEVENSQYLLQAVPTGHSIAFLCTAQEVDPGSFNNSQEILYQGPWVSRWKCGIDVAMTPSAG